VAAVQLARAHGLRVLGSAGSDAGIEVVKRAGAHEVFNHKENGYLDKVMVGISSWALYSYMFLFLKRKSTYRNLALLATICSCYYTDTYMLCS
jgi:NADPH:quinone reductase-like Zn-dependent oxidoreductase